MFLKSIELTNVEGLSWEVTNTVKLQSCELLSDLYSDSGKVITGVLLLIPLKKLAE
jgi:hypothetical protein